MNRYVFAGILAIAGAIAINSGTVTAEKQNPTQTPPPTQATPPPTQAPPKPQTPPPPTQPVARAGGSSETTLVGCLYNEKDVPGRQPNVAERTGVMEDFILAEATSASGQAPATGKMYKVESIPDEKLRAHVGKRVEIVGRIDAEAGDVQRTSGGAVPSADRNASRDSIELPEFEAVSIKEVQGTCPAKPAKQ